MIRTLERVAAFFKRRCKHNGRVVADITEGELLAAHLPRKSASCKGIAWCQTCGAICRSPGTWELAIDPRLDGPVTSEETPYEAKKMRLSPFWFLTDPRRSRASDGRTGVPYTAPFVMTTIMLIRNLFRRPENRAHWTAYREFFFAEDGSFEPARIVRTVPARTHGIEDAPRSPRWLLDLEYRLSRWGRARSLRTA